MTCPNCGAPVQFRGAQSLTAVCAHCRSALVRSGASLENLGKVPDLVATRSRLKLGAHGSIDHKPFLIIGHIQPGEANGAVWDEWHIQFGAGEWAWLAEAQGRLYFTKLVPDALSLPKSMSVDENNEAQYLSAEGELPDKISLGEKYRFTDASGDDDSFATLDYSGDRPRLYVGRELTYAAAGLAGYEPIATAGKEAKALRCPNCGGPVSLRVSTSESVTCPNCHALLDPQQEPAKLIKALESRTRPRLPLGSKGILRGIDSEVIGWIARSTRVESVTYSWQEYLLYGPDGYRWLSESGGHWVLQSPIAAGKVHERDGAVWSGETHYRLFDASDARYDEIQGELYWRIEVDQRVKTQDFIAPPQILSCERTPSEINWSIGESIDGSEIWKSLNVSGGPPVEVGVGMAQPNPYRTPMGHAWKTALIALSVATIIAIAWSSTHPRQSLAELTVPVGKPDEAVALTEPFEISGGPQALEIRALAEVQQAWIGIDVALINDESGESDAAAFELSHYEGYDQGEHWAEGNRSGRAILSHVPDGRYVLRAEAETQREPGGVLPDSVHVQIDKGVFVPAPLWLALLGILIVPLALSFKTRSFETQRWSNSDFTP